MSTFDSTRSTRRDRDRPNGFTGFPIAVPRHERFGLVWRRDLGRNGPPIPSGAETHTEGKGLFPPTMTPSTRTEAGILVLLDMVEYTPQVKALGDEKAAQLASYFKNELIRRADPRGFEHFKALGDAALLFGKGDESPHELIELMLDLFTRDPIKPFLGFQIRLRMIAHHGFFEWEFDESGRRIDVHGSEAIKEFRIEKRLWDVASGREVRTFQGHTNAVRACALSADGGTLVSGSSDNTLKLWDVATGKELASFALPWTPYQITFSRAKPHSFFTANLNGTVTLFDIGSSLNRAK